MDEDYDDVFTLGEAEHSCHEPIASFYAADLGGEPASSEAEADAMSSL